jgi:hypothetical protein
MAIDFLYGKHTLDINFIETLNVILTVFLEVETLNVILTVFCGKKVSVERNEYSES